MSGQTVLVTGASGFLGSHLARRLVEQQFAVRVLVRPTSDRRSLHGAPLESIVGDLRDAAAVERAVAGVDTVFHCAARLGDWGPWSDFQQGTVATTERLVDACRAHRIRRLLHVSSVAAYGHPRTARRLVAEDDPLGQRLGRHDHYARSKMLAERLARQLGQQTTVVRPTWIYGPGERVILPRIIDAVRRGRARLVGSGRQHLNLVHVEDVVDGLMRAAFADQAAGQAYNLSSQGEISQREFFQLLVETLDLPPVRRRVPWTVAYGAAWAMELAARLARRRQPPRITRHGLSLLTRPPSFSSQRAREQLGWQPQVPAREGLRQTLLALHKRA